MNYSIYRFGVSLERSLIDKFDQLIKRRRYTNRSKAIADLIRKELIHTTWEAGGEIAGAIILLYNHHKRDLLAKMTDIQHDYQRYIVSTQHIHLDHDNCLEIIAVRGKADEINTLADKLISLKGVKHGDISFTSAKAIP
ncbi:MAG: nickel-responsive transcriptional regulator NikR [Myxococcota bacterium]